MIFLGHAATGYLLAQLPSAFGRPLPLLDQSLIFIAGNFLDLDLLYSKFLVKQTFNHHFSPTHTPVFALILSLIFYFIFGHNLSPVTNFLIFISMMLHLAFDDISYWFTKLGLEKSSPHPQIFWSYPVDSRRNGQTLPSHVPLAKVLANYYFKAPWTFGLELLITSMALLVFISYHI